MNRLKFVKSSISYYPDGSKKCEKRWRIEDNSRTLASEYNWSEKGFLQDCRERCLGGHFRVRKYWNESMQLYHQYYEDNSGIKILSEKGWYADGKLWFEQDNSHLSLPRTEWYPNGKIKHKDEIDS